MKKTTKAKIEAIAYSFTFLTTYVGIFVYALIK